MVEVFSDHIECLIRSVSNHEQVTAVAQSKYSRLHISRTKDDFVHRCQVQIVAQIGSRQKR